MKTLNDYLEKDLQSQDGGFYPAFVKIALREAWRQGITEIKFTKNEFDAFVDYYDQILPYDWDGKSFRGIKIIR